MTTTQAPTSTHCSGCGVPFVSTVRVVAALCEECLDSDRDDAPRCTCPTCVAARISVARHLTGKWGP